GWYLQRGDAEAGLRAAAHLVQWFTWRLPLEGRRWLERLLACPGAEQPSLARAWALHSLGWVVWLQGQQDLARQRVEEAATRAHTLGDRKVLGHALMGQAVAGAPGDAGAIELAQGALDLFRELDDEATIPSALAALGTAASKAGQRDVATAAFLGAVAVGRARARGTLPVAPLEGILGWLAAAESNWEVAAVRYRTAIRIGRSARDTELARQLISLGMALCALAEPEQAAAALREGLTLAQGLQYAVLQIFAVFM